MRGWHKAYTLVELVVTVVVVAIIAAIGVPRFVRVMEKTREQEALAALHQIRAAERLYRMHEGRYWPNPNGTVNNIAVINTALRLDLDNSINRNWNYSVTTTTANNFTASAVRIGKATNNTITINEQGTIGGNWVP